ncbi:hypothetical protein QE443_004683 [Pantoea ananatis]|uniref:hypothetical protein n=1 Tax=Pantoea ananas TaxID=553 RepID=UPI0027841A8C|nr:hypothetical protein [Pantoea ananatis]MDQ1228422.1 hypothetical protein [Pantoea ananatis]
MIEIDLPDMGSQKEIVRKKNVQNAQVELENGLNAPRISGPEAFNYRNYSTRHLLTESDGWEPPAHEVVNAWFEHFKSWSEYSSDKKLGQLLGLTGNNVDRRIRQFRLGERSVPYGIWRRFLVMTGRVTQEIIPVIVIIEDIEKNEDDPKRVIVYDEFHIFHSAIKKGKPD